MLRAFLSRFRRDKRGAIAVLIAIAIIPLIGMIGLATDAARGFLAQSRLSSAVDAARRFGHDGVRHAAFPRCGSGI